MVDKNPLVEQAIRDTRSLLQALSTLHGVELQAENVMRARANLVQVATAIAIDKGIDVELFALAVIVSRNIKQGNFLEMEEQNEKV